MLSGKTYYRSFGHGHQVREACVLASPSKRLPDASRIRRAPDSGQNQEIEVDIIGARFPYRAENLVRPRVDDSCFSGLDEKILVVFVEVMVRLMRLNGS